jgi:hypothetical protein
MAPFLMASSFAKAALLLMFSLGLAAARPVYGQGIYLP